MGQGWHFLWEKCDILRLMFSKKNFRNYLPLILVILLASFLRLFWLDKIPNAIGGDELLYVVTVKAIALSGHDLSGTWNPLSIFLFHYPLGELQAELPYFLLLPIVGFFKFSLLSARITYAFLSIGEVVMVYLIARRLISKNAALAAGLIAGINPWLVYIGRTDYEVVPSGLFFLAGLYVLLIAKGRRILWSIPVLMLAFYSYVGTKLIFFPFVLASVLYCYFYVNNKKYLKEYLIVCFFSLALVLFFVLSLKLNPAFSRISEIASINDPLISSQVDAIRKVSIHNGLTNLFVNKDTIFAGILITKFFKSFSFDYLFVTGDEFFSVWRHGLFYALDFVFLISGVLFLFAKSRKIASFLLCLTVIAIIPQILHTVTTDNFTHHISLVFPFLIIFIGVGIWEIIKLFSSKKYFYASSILIVFLYGLSLLNFLNIYFYEHPLGGFFDFPIRIASKYIEISRNSGQQIFVYSNGSYDLFKKYLFYSNALNKDSVPRIKNAIANSKAGNGLKFGNVNFVSCDNTIDFSKTSSIAIYDVGCGRNKENSHIKIPRLSDGGESFRIYNDKVCSKFGLKPYPSDLKISDFEIEDQTLQKFCETFITR